MKQRNGWLLALTIVPFVLCALCCHRAYETNDDAVMQGFVSGFYTGQPGLPMVFSAVVLSEIWGGLYAHFPNWNWYLVTQTSLSLLAVYVLFWRMAMMPVAAILALLLLPLWVSPMYTATAMLCTLAGHLLLLHYAQGGRRRWAVAGLALALAGMWVRWHSFLVVWLLALPVWGCLLNTQRRWSSLVWPLGLIALLQIHRSAEANWYQQHFHHDVWAYQQAVDVIVSNPNHIDSLDLVQHQLTPADYALMQQWSGIDRERHSESVWLSLADGESGWRSPAEAIKRLAVLLWQEWYYCWALLPLMVLLIRAATRLGRARSWAICLGLIVAGLCGYGLVFFRLPHRLFYPMLVTALIFLFFLVKISSEAQIDFFYHFYKNKIKTLYTAAFLTAFPIALQLWYSNGQNALTQQAFAAQYAFTQAHPNKVFIVGGGAMPIEALCQWRNPALHSAHNLIPTGWPIHTPAYQAILQYHHIENPIDALLETPAPMLIGLPLGPLSLYFEQHHATPILFDTIAQWPGLIVQPNIEQ